jgi:hypothetical protein
MARAMRRFCVTARICRPSEVRAQQREQGGEHQQAEDDDPERL